ncbi:MAG: hypothetical protein OQJ98_00015 [Candidatus Pacebacteria bacterium]|nr:hypothetical protein [Candidatus Paceibacterota bacterium]
MKHTVIIREGANLSQLNAAVVVLGHLREVLHGSTLYSTYAEMLKVSKESGIPLSDIGTSEEEIKHLCRVGSLNVLRQFSELLEAHRKLESSDSTKLFEDTIRDEVACNHVTREDLENLELFNEFGIYLEGVAGCA